jgi:hypothetical protein
MRESSAGTRRPAADRRHVAHTAPDGPEIRETWLHRREQTMRVSVTDLCDLTEYQTEEVATLSVGQFFLSGAAWLGVGKYFEEGPGSPALLFCALAAAFGAILFGVGLRQVSRKRKKLDRLLGEVEEADAH